jgi:hypothetical protein
VFDVLVVALTHPSSTVKTGIFSNSNASASSLRRYLLSPNPPTNKTFC